MTENDKDESLTAVNETAGSLLKTAREAAGMTIEQAADKLHLLKATVIALEEDDESALPSRVFTLGYLKNFARIVDVPESRLLELVGEEDNFVEEVKSLKQPSAPPIRSRSRIRPHRNGSRLFARAATLLVMIAFIGLLVLWWRGAIQLPEMSSLPFFSSTEEQQVVESVDDGSETLVLSIGDGTDTQQKTEISLDAAVTDKQPLKASAENSDTENSIKLSFGAENVAPASGTEEKTPGSPEDESDAKITEDTTEDTTEDSTEDSTAEVVVENVAADAEKVNEGAVEQPQASSAEEITEKITEKITLDFADKCWVNVNDAQGNIVLFGDMSAGASKTLQGNAPFTFVLGNATKVKISVDGRPYDIAPHIKGGVARFSLGNPEQ